jgi:type IV secretory pathway VirJ component
MSRRSPTPLPPATALRSIAAVAVALVCALAAVLTPAPSLARTLILIPSRGAPTGPLVVFYSGDGGWAGADRRIAAGLSRRGMPVVGVNALHYFWRRRSPEQAAADLDGIIAGASRLWGRTGVVLAGYSFGAGALPLVAAHLSPASLARVQLIVLIAPGEHGEMVLRPRSWFDIPSRQAVRLDWALQAIRTPPVMCIYAIEDRRAACPHLAPSVAVRALTGGHHFHGETDAVAATIARAALAGVAEKY